MEIDIFKNRSFSSCMHEAFKFITTNFQDLIKKTWFPILLCSFLTSFLIYSQLPNKQLTVWSTAHIMPTIYIGLLLIISVITSFIYYIASFLKFFDGFSLKSHFKKVTAFTIFAILVAIVAIVACMYGGIAIAAKMNLRHLQFTLIISFVALIVMIISAPITYSFFKYNNNKCNFIQAIKSIKLGFKHWGITTATLFLSSLITGIIISIIAIPVWILFITQAVSQLGALDGDPLGTPVYFTVLLIGTNTIINAITFFAIYWLLAALYFTFGSIEAQELEKSTHLIK
jgi:hypothetical protein